ncbi:MAG: hypothetical protein ACRDVE_13570 [Actinocrinis sp.]
MSDPIPSLLCNVRELSAQPDSGVAEGVDPTLSGAVWKLSEHARQLDANVVHLPAARTVQTHAEPDLDVLLLVLAGAGTLDTVDGPLPLVEGALMWLPHGSTRSLTAGDDGLYYLTTHRRRPGMSIRNARGTTEPVHTDANA